MCRPTRRAIPYYSRGGKQANRAGGAAGSSSHAALERRQSVPVVPPQPGRPPRGHVASVREEGEAVQSCSLGPDGWKRLATHSDHTVGNWPGECKFVKTFEDNHTGTNIQQHTFCATIPGHPEGGARARQEWSDGRGRHQPDERHLHRGAQPKKTLTP